MRVDRHGKSPGVSLVIPVYDERECLPVLLDEIAAAMSGASDTYEVVLVDDGSTDGSGELLDEASARDPRVVAVHFARNAGQSAAFVEGFRRARGGVIVTLDADGQNPPSEISRLLAALEEDVDAVVGYREFRHDSAWRRFQSSFANAVRNRLTHGTIRDTGCSLKAIRSQWLEGVPRFDGMHRFIPTLCRLAGARRIVEVPVGHRPRQGGRSKYGMPDRAWRGLIDLLAIRWMQRRRLRYEIRGARRDQSTK